MMVSRMTQTSARDVRVDGIGTVAAGTSGHRDRQDKAGDDDGAQDHRPAPNCAGFIVVPLGLPLHWRRYYQLGFLVTSHRFDLVGHRLHICGQSGGFASPGDAKRNENSDEGSPVVFRELHCQI